jgi:RNA polymerase subunit RPABC4/transcription elongation factor Spt4
MIFSRGRQIACAACEAVTEPGARFCPACGQPFPRSAPIGLACPHCASACVPGTEFCEVCGGALPAQPYLIINASGLRVNLFAADQISVVVGRADALSGVTPDLNLEPYAGELAGLSRRHARLWIQQDQYWIEDLNSVNWTYLNQQRLTPEQPQLLNDGDLLRMGNVVLTFRETR